ncbi:hypothetical protein KFE94_07220 [bacterium SCSIO 12643]|nr:hypothetical protein KFE94_07220 [bacterium SCSIO 12643]
MYILRIILVFFPIFIGCTIKSSDSVENQFHKEKVVIDKVFDENLILYREKCKSGVFNLCSDGHEQPYRIFPYFVRLNRQSFIASYDTIFLFPSDETRKEILSKGLECMNTLEMDKMFEDIEGKHFKINSDEFCEKVSKYNKVHKSSDITFCEIDYEIYNLSFSFVYGGVKQIIVPNFDIKDKSLIRFYKSKVFYITAIDKVGVPL